MSSADIAFLQETCSTCDVVDKYLRFQWPGKFFYSHGTNHSKGVKSEVQDKDGRYILVDAIIQDSPFLLLNIYAPNNTAEQCTFFSGILNTLEEATHDLSRQLLSEGILMLI